MAGPSVLAAIPEPPLLSLNVLELVLYAELVARLLSIASFVLIFYDYIITLDEEVRKFVQCSWALDFLTVNFLETLKGQVLLER
jgi:hypothetical protein